MKAAPDAQSGGRATIAIAAVLLLIAVHITWQAWVVAAAPYPARYDYDEGAYAETAAARAAGARLYTSIFLSQPPLLIEVLGHTFAAFGRSLKSARGSIVAFSVLWLAGVAAIAARAGGLRAAVWAVGIAASAPAFVAASHTVQMEGPAEALAALAMSLALAAAARAHAGAPRTAGVFWGSAGLAAGLAAMTKYTALTCVVPLVLVLVVDRADTPARTTAAHAALLLGAAALSAGAVLVSTGSASADMWRQTVVFHRDAANATPPDLGRTASLLGAFGAANWFVAALGLAGLAAAFAAWRRGRRGPQPAAPGRHVAAVSRGAMAAWLLVNLAAIVVWRPVWPHHFAMLITPLAVLGAAAVETAWRTRTRAGIEGSLEVRLPSGRKGVRWAAGATVALWLVALATAMVGARPENSDGLRAATAEIRRAVPPAAQVVADDPLIPFLADRNVPAALCDTSEMRMRTGWLTAASLRAALGNPRVRAIVLWRGTFRRLAPAFVDAAVAQFPHRWTLAAGREILAR